MSLEVLGERIVPAILYVDALGDAGVGRTNSGDIRYCINLLNASQDATNTISFQVGGTISLSSSLPTILKTVTIQGTGRQTIQGSGGAGNAYRIFTINNTVNAEIDGLTIKGGYDNSDTGGGGIANYGSLTLKSDTITDNFSENNGGGIYNYSGASLSLTSVNISDNTAGEDGGGIENMGTITEGTSTAIAIVENTATIGSGGGISNLGTVTFDQDGSIQISGNSAGLNGGGIENAPSANFTLVEPNYNDGIMGNTAAQYGGGLYNDGTATLNDVNVESNKANKGGGMYLDVLSTTTVTAVLVQNNELQGDGAAGAGVYMFPVAVLNDSGGLDDLDDPGGVPVQGH